MITGASRGLGRALALSFAREGASLALCARGATDLAAVSTAARRHGVDVVAESADIGTARDVERFVATSLARLGRVDVLVNNASDLGPVPLPHLTDAPSEGLLRVLDVNVVGPFRLTQAVIGGMLLRGGGLVINVTSDAAVEGYPGWGLYGASKAALEALTRSWDAELRGSGVLLCDRSDTEVLFQLIRRDGVRGAVERVDGMFAFAFRDGVSGALSLVRDRFGEKPLYWGMADGRPVFAPAIGSVTTNVLPRSTSLSTRTVPPCSSTRWRTM